MDTALLALRLCVGGLLVAHATRVLFGRFNGAGRPATARRFEALGYRPGLGFATACGGAEGVAGTLLLVGLLVPLAATVVIGIMVATVGTLHPHWDPRPTAGARTDGGPEYPAAILAFAATFLAFTGPGGFAIDGRATGIVFGVMAIAVGVSGGLAVLTFRQAPAPAVVRRRARVTERPSDETVRP